jgi:hypothetical protein
MPTIIEKRWRKTKSREEDMHVEKHGIICYC